MPTVGQLVSSVNTLSEEILSTDDIVLWFNNAIARINVESNANFPYLTGDVEESPAFGDDWHYLLLIPFATARIKQMDSSQFEYNDLFGEFENNLRKFVAFYEIPEIYKKPPATNASSIDVVYSVRGW